MKISFLQIVCWIITTTQLKQKLSSGGRQDYFHQIKFQKKFQFNLLQIHSLVITLIAHTVYLHGYCGKINIANKFNVKIQKNSTIPC
mmetsp:Transcript_5612/g.7850  ORF Transcript_5612/g.7850 Transcript_5612/m.7850 type:complete len:87 (+) Transcript_5612:670-930(+)